MFYILFDFFVRIKGTMSNVSVKLLMTACIACIVSDVTFAADTNLFASFGGVMSLTSSATEPTTGVHKRKMYGGFRLAGGYALRDNLRLALSYEHDFVPNFLFATNNQWYNTGGVVWNNTYTKHKVVSDSLMLRAYYDIAKVFDTTFYVSGGLGMTRLRDSVVYTLAKTANNATVTTTLQKGVSSNTTPSYSIGLGGSMELTENIVVDLSYDFTYRGMTKSLASSQSITYDNVSYSSFSTKGKFKLQQHNLSANVRMNF